MGNADGEVDCVILLCSHHNGLFLAVAERPGAGPVVTWEEFVGDEKTIFADVLE